MVDNYFPFPRKVMRLFMPKKFQVSQVLLLLLDIKAEFGFITLIQNQKSN